MAENINIPYTTFTIGGDKNQLQEVARFQTITLEYPFPGNVIENAVCGRQNSFLGFGGGQQSFKVDVSNRIAPSDSDINVVKLAFKPFPEQGTILTLNIDKQTFGIDNTKGAGFEPKWTRSTWSYGSGPNLILLGSFFLFRGTITFRFDVYSYKVGRYIYFVGSEVTVGYSVRNGNAIINGVPLPPVQVRGITSSREETKITIQSATECIGGQNLTHVFFSADEREWAHRPCFTKMVKGNRCTLVQKYNDFSATGVDVNLLETYGLLRYFLWFLITGKWYINILLQSNTKKFLKALKKSEYSVWVKTFTTGELKGYDKYYVE